MIRTRALLVLRGARVQACKLFSIPRRLFRFDVNFRILEGEKRFICLFGCPTNTPYE